MLKIFFTIARRNVVKNKKRSLLIGLAVFVSSVILLSSGALANGAGRQLAARYRNLMAGDVSVVWANVKDIDPSDAGRLFFSEFDPKKKEANLAAAARCREYLSAHANEIETVYAPVRAFGLLEAGRYASFGTIYGASDNEIAFLAHSRIFDLAAGETFAAYDDYAAVISEEMATENRIAIGDWITVDGQTPQGYVNSIEFAVVGLYRKAAPWDNKTIYMSEKNARELLQWDERLFALARVYLKRPERRPEFARGLDAFLLTGSDVLRAEPNGAAGEFYLTFGQTLKSVFLCFTVFLLFVIGLGIRSTVRLNVFERLGEFGTLRAIGFGRSGPLFIIFFEVLVLSLVALAAAFLLTLALVFVFSFTGVYMGDGVLNSILGGEYLFPALDLFDVLTALALIAVFSLIAPLKPALRVCLQKITDLLARNQKQSFAIAYLILMIARKIFPAFGKKNSAV
jgi:putative ABC transport system permease protein